MVTIAAGMNTDVPCGSDWDCSLSLSVLVPFSVPCNLLPLERSDLSSHM